MKELDRKKEAESESWSENKISLSSVRKLSSVLSTV